MQNSKNAIVKDSEMYLTKEFRKKGIRKVQGKEDCKFGGDKERQRNVTRVQSPKKAGKTSTSPAYKSKSTLKKSSEKSGISVTQIS